MQKEVNLEVGWLSLAHNLLKKAAVDQKQKNVGTGIIPVPTFLLFKHYF
ncbi:hypothetical protein ACFO1S_11205 [Cohnella boryungensis]|uniref:Transposase DDE domain-containing protein n=1 Tax=Cohnella boryungensis TaxID=768479 RepID=A0ABV8S8W6_9BACL